jgi:hypothetical protein
MSDSYFLLNSDPMAGIDVAGARRFPKEKSLGVPRRLGGENSFFALFAADWRHGGGSPT